MKKNEYTKTCNYPADALKIPESPDLAVSYTHLTLPTIA